MAVRTVIVDPRGGNQFKSINDAIRACVTGDSIHIAPGQYDEVVVLDKHVQLMPLPTTTDATTDAMDVVITGGVISTAPDGLVKGLTIQQQVIIRSGRVTIERCTISQGSDGIRVCSDAEPMIRQCHISHATTGGDGIYFQANAKGLVEDCDISQCRVNGIHVNGSDVTLRRNRIRQCPYGIFFRKEAKGLIETNTIEGASLFGIYILEHSCPTVVQNTVLDCGIHGIMLSNKATGVLKENTVHASLRVMKGCFPTLGSNQIIGHVYDDSAGQLTMRGEA